MPPQPCERAVCSKVLMKLLPAWEGKKCFAAGNEQPWQRRGRSAAFCLAAGRAMMQGENFPARPRLLRQSLPVTGGRLFVKLRLSPGKVCLLQEDAFFRKAAPAPAKSACYRRVFFSRSRAAFGKVKFAIKGYFALQKCPAFGLSISLTP